MSIPIKGAYSDGYVCGYASVFHTLDCDNDIVLPGAFAQSLTWWEKHDATPPMLWQHSAENVVGRWIELVEDEYGLCVYGRLDLAKTCGRRIHHLLQVGEVKELSIGFLPARVQQYEGVQYIVQADLYEISLVAAACNRMAHAVVAGNNACAESCFSILQKEKSI